jgi:putative membrane-bound dehydrogenase-like protein
MLRIFFLCLSAAVLFTGVTAANEPPKPLKILLVCGGCCHDYQTQKNILQTGLEERAHVEVTVVHQGGSATDSKIELYENPDWAKGYDLVIHDECFADVKDKQWVDQILKPHRDGLPGVVIHCAMHCYRTGADDWFEFCGVTSRGHGAAYPHEVLNRDGSHPIMKNFGAAWANPAGELYHIEKVWKTAHPLASAKNRENGKEEVCVWTNQYREKTRVFGTTLGHHNETVRSPEFLDTLTRGVLWACDKLDDNYLKERKPQLVAVNVAQGKKATASSEETGKNNLAPHAVDGKADTRWCANTSEKNQWLQIDLGKPETLTGCAMNWESDGAVYSYKLEGSSDGKTWKTLVDGSKNQQPGSSTHKFDAKDVRYARLTFLGSNTGSWGSLWEVELFGTEMREVAPNGEDNEEEKKILSEVKVPEGFEAKLFAAPPAVIYPVSVCAAPDGTVYVAVDKNGSLDRKPNHGAIYRLRDLDGDGRADETKLFVANVDSPRGLVWDHDRLYVMHPPHLSAFIDRDGDGISEEQQVLVKNIAFTFKDRPADHTSNGVTLGIDGWLYLAIGDFGFMEAEGTDGRKLQLRGGGVVRVRPDGTGLELYTHGTRNILEVAMDPLLNGFSRDNTNDGGGWDIRLHHYTGMDDHGYPRLYMNFNEEVIQPLADYGGGSGCGGLYMDEPGFPEGFGNALYTCDWGRNWVYRHRLTPRGATFDADQSEAFGLTRVTDLDVDAMSRIYVTSWKGATFTYVGENVGYLVQVTPKGYKPEPLPDFAQASDAELVKLLASPSHRRRMEAQRALIRRGLKNETADKVQRLAADKSQSLATRVAAVFALKQGLEKEATPRLIELAQDAMVREYAIRALADRLEENVGVSGDIAVAGLQDKNPRVRLASLIALARLGRQEPTAAMTALLADADPVVAHTAVKALVALKGVEACFAVVDKTDAAPTLRIGALRVLQSLHQADVVAGLLARLAKETDPQRRQGLLIALCRLYNTEGEWKGDSWGTRPDTSGPYYQPVTWNESDKILKTLTATLNAASPDEAAFLLREMNRHKVKVEGALEKLIPLATNDAKLLPALVAEVLRSRNLPDAALPLVAKAATSSDMELSLRSHAVQALALSSQAEALQAAMQAMEALSKPGTGNGDFQKARDALLNAKLDRQVDLLEAEAAKLNTTTSVWADALLLRVITAKDTPVEVRAIATKAVDAGWSDTKRRVQMLNAIRLSNNRTLENRVLESFADADPNVVSTAKQVASAMNIKPAAPSSGPLVESLKTDDVIAAVLKTKGKVEIGAQLFTKLECTKCHTTRADEPPKGPFLGTIANTYKRKDLAEAVLLPSKTLAQGFVTNLIVTDDGKQVTGFVVQEAADKIVLRNADGKEIVIPTAEIEERHKLTTSVMPEGLVKKLTVEEFASLIDYIESLPKK